MKKLLLFVFLFSFNAFSYERGVSVEEAYIHDPSGMIRELILQNPELTIDHATKDGFELYGPEGLNTWLINSKINFSPLLRIDDADDYPSFEENTLKLKKIAHDYPDLVQMFSIGKSMDGRELWVLKVSHDVKTDRRVPEFKYISSMHGDEITGRELLMRFIPELLSKYGQDARVTNLINNTELYFMPSMNPDGSYMKRRYNRNYIDLNRNFPDFFLGEENKTEGREVETVHAMNFQKERHFSLSANFHGGTIVANYPWDNSRTRHPLDAMLKEFSTIYSNLNPMMRESREFPGGITNGSDWYMISGGMQDWSYIFYNDLQITVELSNTKWPRYKDIPSFYDANYESMLSYMELVHQGAGFLMDDKNTAGYVEVLSLTDGKDLGKFSFKDGEFYKVLPSGEYEFSIETTKGIQKINASVRKNQEVGSYIHLP